MNLFTINSELIRIIKIKLLGKLRIVDLARFLKIPLLWLYLARQFDIKHYY